MLEKTARSLAGVGRLLSNEEKLMQDASTRTYLQPQPVSLSPDLVAKLKAAQGEGLSRDPKNNPRKTIILLQEKDLKWCRSGASAGQYLISDKLCDDFVWTPIAFFDTFIEWGADGGRPVEHFTLPDDASWDQNARCYFRNNGNSVEEGAEIVGLIDGEPRWLSFSKYTLTAARNLNSTAGYLVIETVEGAVQVPFFGANWRMGSTGKQGSNGKTYWQPTYKLVATVGEPGGPSWDDFNQGRKLYQRLTKWVALTKARIEAVSDISAPTSSEEPPNSEAPPPTGDDPPRSFEDLDDIPF
jgi:hypothetical protein